MATQLHIIVRPENPITGSAVQIPSDQAETEVLVVDLSKGTPDYGKLLDEIFAAQTIAVW